MSTNLIFDLIKPIFLVFKIRECFILLAQIKNYICCRRNKVEYRAIDFSPRINVNCKS